MIPVVDVDRGRRRRRQHRVDRRGRRPEGRPAQRGRRARPDLLRARRRAADHHGRQRRPRSSRSHDLPRRRNEAEPRGGARRHSRRRSRSRSDGLSVESAARAIVDIAVAKMSLAVRQVSVEKGYDPRDFALVASGGAGPLHAVAIARELSIPTVIIPWFPAHFSALGMLMADERHDARAHLSGAARDARLQRSGAASAELETDLHAHGAARTRRDRRSYLDLRYVGQEFNCPSR